MDVIDRWLNEHVNANAILDAYVVDIESSSVMVMYHIWEGEGLIKNYSSGIVKAKFEDIGL